MIETMKLKVCGLRDNIRQVAALAPDYIGFIFYETSPRFVGHDFEIPNLNEGIKKVGVFVNESAGKVKALVERYNLDYVQLHGTESQQYCDELKNEGIGTIKAFQVDEAFDFDMLNQYESVTDYFLFDTKSKNYGGSGMAFDWGLLKKYSLDKPYFLSGGISLDNVKDLEKIDLSKVHALDVNSRFEIRPGLKNVEDLKDFIARLEN